ATTSPAHCRKRGATQRPAVDSRSSRRIPPPPLAAKAVPSATEWAESGRLIPIAQRGGGGRRRSASSPHRPLGQAPTPARTSRSCGRGAGGRCRGGAPPRSCSPRSCAARRRQREVHHVEAVVEVLPEPAGAHLALEVAVGGGDEAHVDRYREARAQRRHLALLHGAQELRLERERDLRHLVEEEGAALGGA